MRKSVFVWMRAQHGHGYNSSQLGFEGLDTIMIGKCITVATLELMENNQTKRMCMNKGRNLEYNTNTPHKIQYNSEYNIERYIQTFHSLPGYSHELGNFMMANTTQHLSKLRPTCSFTDPSNPTSPLHAPWPHPKHLDS